jgi:hypothetical protein
LGGHSDQRIGPPTAGAEKIRATESPHEPLELLIEASDSLRQSRSSIIATPWTSIPLVRPTPLGLSHDMIKDGDFGSPFGLAGEETSVSGDHRAVFAPGSAPSSRRTGWPCAAARSGRQSACARSWRRASGARSASVRQCKLARGVRFRSTRIRIPLPRILPIFAIRAFRFVDSKGKNAIPNPNPLSTGKIDSYVAVARTPPHGVWGRTQETLFSLRRQPVQNRPLSGSASAGAPADLRHLR